MRHLLLSLTLAVPCACSTVSTTEIRYDRELVQYVTVPAGVPAAAQATADAEGDARAESADPARLEDVRVVPASAPLDSQPVR